MNPWLFISDLHLDPSRPRATATFLSFLGRGARNAEHLYILGDLFEFWIGDDADCAHAREVQDALAEYTGSGHRCSVMRGNRDFLLGPAFAHRTGTHLLADPAIETIAGQDVLLMHGDRLCTDDHGYQRYRRIVNNAGLQRLFLALPRSWRKAAGARGRARSRRHQASRPAAIMDVNAAAVNAAFTHHGTDVLIHGHTHRPAIHRLEIGGRQATRIVLGDWYQQGSLLRWDGAGFDLRSLPFG